MWRWADVKMSRCEDEQMWRWADVKMRRCEDEKMWRWEDVKRRRCEDEKVWRWENVKMRKWEDEIQTPTIGRTLRSDALGKNDVWPTWRVNQSKSKNPQIPVKNKHACAKTKSTKCCKGCKFPRWINAWINQKPKVKRVTMQLCDWLAVGGKTWFFAWQ
jgi:hypothetical protein